MTIGTKIVCKSPRIWLIHRCYFSSNFWPFQLSFEPAIFIPRCLKFLFPFKQLVRETQMRLDYDVEPPSTDEAICSGKRETKGSHDFCNANRC